MSLPSKVSDLQKQLTMLQSVMQHESCFKGQFRHFELEVTNITQLAMKIWINRVDCSEQFCNP